MDILPDRNSVDRGGVGEKCLAGNPSFTEAVNIKVDGAFACADNDVMPCSVRPVPIDGEGTPLVFVGQNLVAETYLLHRQTQSFDVITAS